MFAGSKELMKSFTVRVTLGVSLIVVSITFLSSICDTVYLKILNKKKFVWYCLCITLEGNTEIARNCLLAVCTLLITQ